MRRTKITKFISLIVTTGGVIVITGWIFDIEVLKSMLPTWVTMKFSTALSFLLSGITLYIVSCSFEKKSDGLKIVLTFVTLIILIIMATLFISIFLNIYTGVEDLFVKETKNTISTSVPGRPSLGTIINFILVALAGIFAMFEMNNLSFKLYYIGLFIFVSGYTAVFGYILSIPILYYNIENISTAMALHTAFFFMITGAGFIILRNESEYYE